ncbi:hypothetical protein J6590_059214 [Homalodisca vitripennis]|nr:hypothetical protein J6590_059214 [Homalodisca vitripennis]
MLPPVCTPPSYPTSHNLSATQSTLRSVQSQVTHQLQPAFVCLVWSQIKLLDMSSSESEDLDNKPSANKQFFVNLLSEHVVVFEKSRVPKEENPVFKKVQGATSVGIVNHESLVVPNDDEGTSTGRNSSASSTSKSTSLTYVRAGVKSINKYETDETKELSLPQLQRLVLLKQLELQNLQIEKEKREAEKNKGVEKSTQTDYK